MPPHSQNDTPPIPPGTITTIDLTVYIDPQGVNWPPYSIVTPAEWVEGQDHKHSLPWEWWR